MIEVKAYIRPAMIDDVVRALRQAGHCCMTLVWCEGTGHFTSTDQQRVSVSFTAMHTRMAKMEIVCEARAEKEIVEIILQHGRTGRAGDGMVFVSPVSGAFRIRDGRESLDAADAAPG